MRMEQIIVQTNNRIYEHVCAHILCIYAQKYRGKMNFEQQHEFKHRFQGGWAKEIRKWYNKPEKILMFSTVETGQKCKSF